MAHLPGQESWGTKLGGYANFATEIPSLVPIVGGLYDYGRSALHGDGAGMLFAIGNIGADVATGGAAGAALRAEAKLALKELPVALRGGEATVHVYDGVKKAEPVYVGITNNLANRQAGHGDRFVLNPLTSTAVTRGEARAIEQARIVENPSFQNIRNSISPKHSYYQQAVEWGKQWLRTNGF